jgi:hypothetical protein
MSKILSLSGLLLSFGGLNPRIPAAMAPKLPRKKGRQRDKQSIDETTWRKTPYPKPPVSEILGDFRELWKVPNSESKTLMKLQSPNSRFGSNSTGKSTVSGVGRVQAALPMMFFHLEFEFSLEVGRWGPGISLSGIIPANEGPGNSCNEINQMNFVVMCKEAGSSRGAALAAGGLSARLPLIRTAQFASVSNRSGNHECPNPT